MVIWLANITLYLPDEVNRQMRNHPEIRWTQVVREALVEKAQRLRKLEILEKYLDKAPFDASDLEWMDENDWHPVDEKQLAVEMAAKLRKISKGTFRKVSSLDEIR